MTQCTQERFLEDVNEHTLTIHKDDGVYRHLEMSNNGSSVFRYNIHTWPGGLCIDGDMGAYTFSRLHDMFNFFDIKNKKHPINPSYWGEKLTSIGINAGYESFSQHQFEERVSEHFNDFRSDEEDDPDSYWSEETFNGLWSAIKEEVFTDVDTAERAYDNLSDFWFEEFANDDLNDMVKFEFDAYDLMEGGFNEYTFRYIWGLYAIAHAIALYKETKCDSQ